MSEIRLNLRKVAAGAACLAERKERKQCNLLVSNCKNELSFASNAVLNFRMKFGWIIFVSLSILILNSCVVCKNQIKGDVIGFSDDVHPATFEKKRCIIPYFAIKGAPVDLKTDKSTMQEKISNLKSGTNTAAYKALDLGLTRVKDVKRKYMGRRCPNSKYYLLFFTDGKDNISATTEKSYAKYSKKIEKKMKRTMGIFNHKNAFQSWALLLEGDELQRDGYTPEQLNDMLFPFTGAQNSIRPPVIQARDIETLQQKFIDEFTAQSYSFYIPQGYTGKRVKMILKDKSNNEVTFEGDFVKKGFLSPKYSLINIVTSENFTFEMKNNSISMASWTLKKSDKISFQINRLKKDEKRFIPNLDKGYVTQQFMDKGAYRVNSEYRQDAIKMTDAYILSVIDCSESLGDDTQKAKDMMKKAIDVIVDGTK